jgi:mannose-6-phosphate isomerase-like protein (cupin superfamily)
VNEEELYLIIQGKALVNDNGVEKELNSGDAILTGDGKGHAIKNIGLQPLELIAIILVYA